ncbi:MAG: hypothetical protein R2731_08380 [Nocardioides sp.]
MAAPGRSSRRRRWPSWCTPSRRSTSPAGGGARRTGPEVYELVMGDGRPEAGLTSVPAIVRETDDTMLRDALLENLHRTAQPGSRRRPPTPSS